MVSRKLTMERELLQYIEIFNITVYVDNNLRCYHSFSVDTTIQLPETTSLMRASKISQPEDSSSSSSRRLKEGSTNGTYENIRN
jgi:hypothetical protein